MTVIGGTFRDNEGYGIYASGVITVTGSTFENNGSYGLYTADSTPAWVTDTAFTDNGSYPLRTAGFNLYRAHKKYPRRII